VVTRNPSKVELGVRFPLNAKSAAESAAESEAESARQNSYIIINHTYVII